jgi:hypothetical protein
MPARMTRRYIVAVKFSDAKLYAVDTAYVRGQVGENAEAWAQIKLLRNT